MFSIRCNSKNNVLTVVFRSTVDVRQAEQLVEKLQQELPKLRKGFKILTDLSELDNMDLDYRPYIKKTMNLYNSYGVKTIIRVIPDKSKDIGFNIMSLFHFPREVKIHTCSSLREAEQYMVLLSDTAIIKKMAVLLKISKAKLLNFSSFVTFRLVVISVFFVCLIILRKAVSVFGASLGYLYVIVISLSGFWFGIKGGLASALVASVIFLIEVNIFQSWEARDIVVKSMYLRFTVYVLGGIVFGHLSELEKKLKKNLEFLAAHDALLGCYNFRFLMRILEKEIIRSKRYKKTLVLSIVDIDHFKSLNDRYGHFVGNDVLKAFVQVIMDNIRAEDILGRYGGDEFIIIFPESKAHQAEVVLERIKSKLSQLKISSAYMNRAEGITVTFSAGVASSPVNGKYMNDLINAADSALYQAKRTGRNKVFIESKIFAE
ncbi:MAG: GGDEF domain-containing protein [Candidatus Omnitrophota bacterium]